MTNDPDNPTIFGTQQDCAWSAWQAAFDEGKLLPDHTKFREWWDSIAVQYEWKSTRELMQAAWGKGVQDRNEQCTAGFNEWWQRIVDSQPKEGAPA